MKLPKDIELAIQKTYKEVFKKVLSKAARTSLSLSNVTMIISTLQESKQYTEFAKKLSKTLAKKGLNRQKGLWRKYFEIARKHNVVGLSATYQAFQKKVLDLAISENFNLIKSIPNEVLKVWKHKYSETLIAEVANNKLPRKTFEKQLIKHGYKNAKVIARTEAAKIQTKITEIRSTQIGSKAYIWLSSKDKRTRPSHQKMNGVVVFWRQLQTEKPHLDNMHGNAGEFPNCRCDAQAIFDESDLTDNFYNVYDYRTEKIVRMSKNDLAKSLTLGQL